MSKALGFLSNAETIKEPAGHIRDMRGDYILIKVTEGCNYRSYSIQF